MMAPVKGHLLFAREMRAASGLRRSNALFSYWCYRRHGMAARSRRAPPVCEHFGPKRPRWRLGALDFSEKVANSQPGAAKGAGIPGSRGPYETDRFHPYDVASASLWGGL